MFRLASLSALVLLVSGTVVNADDAVRAMLGKTAPEWSNMAGTDGKPHSSSEHSASKATVIVFLCNHCPCAKSYENRFKAFAKEYRDRGVNFIAFNSDTSETITNMKQRAQDSSFNFDYLKDESQKVAKALKAQTTPHAFVLNSDRKVVFSGAFDDDKSGQKVTKQFVRDAVEDLLAGRPVKVDESKLCGCAISFN